jgi:hypothetical protein
MSDSFCLLPVAKPASCKRVRIPTTLPPKRPLLMCLCRRAGVCHRCHRLGPLRRCPARGDGRRVAAMRLLALLPLVDFGATRRAYATPRLFARLLQSLAPITAGLAAREAGDQLGSRLRHLPRHAARRRQHHRRRRRRSCCTNLDIVVIIDSTTSSTSGCSQWSRLRATGVLLLQRRGGAGELHDQPHSRPAVHGVPSRAGNILWLAWLAVCCVFLRDWIGF